MQITCHTASFPSTGMVSTDTAMVIYFFLGSCVPVFAPGGGTSGSAALTTGATGGLVGAGLLLKWSSTSFTMVTVWWSIPSVTMAG